MNYYLVDFENTKLCVNDDIVKCVKGDKVIVFYSSCCKNISMDVIEDIIRKEASFACFEIKSGTKNALDFQLSSYLGYLIGSGCDDDNIYIVSNDKGYDCLCNFWQNFSCVKVKRISRTLLMEEVVEEKKSPKVKTSDLVTLEEVKTYISEDEHPEEIMNIINAYKTKSAINNGISKYFRDSKVSGTIYKKLKVLLKEKHKT